MLSDWKWRLALILTGIALAVYLGMADKVKLSKDDRNTAQITHLEIAKSRGPGMERQPGKPPGLKSPEPSLDAAVAPLEEPETWMPVVILPPGVTAELEDSLQGAPRTSHGRSGGGGGRNRR